jgi:phosphopantetheinyl transferase
MANLVALGAEFNLSHSRDLILLALRPCRIAGVDVEQLQDVKDWKSIACILWPAAIVEKLERISVAQQSAA